MKFLRYKQLDKLTASKLVPVPEASLDPSGPLFKEKQKETESYCGHAGTSQRNEGVLKTEEHPYRARMRAPVSV